VCVCSATSSRACPAESVSEICILSRHAELPGPRSREAGDPLRIVGSSMSRWGESVQLDRSAAVVVQAARARQLTP
jgi:hypothetical protein